MRFIFKFLLQIRNYIFSIYCLGYYDKSWSFLGLPIISKAKGSSLAIGTDFTACSKSKYNSLGVFQAVTLKTLSSTAKMSIGNSVGMSGASVSCLNEIWIGNNVLIGSGVMITDNDAHSINFHERNDPSKIGSSPVYISDDVFIGARSIILKGVKIGEGAVVGAGSVVTGDVASYSVFAGNPARFIRTIDL